jgi:hypothetical protein
MPSIPRSVDNWLTRALNPGKALPDIEAAHPSQRDFALKLEGVSEIISLRRKAHLNIMRPLRFRNRLGHGLTFQNRRGGLVAYLVSRHTSRLRISATVHSIQSRFNG